MARLIHTLSERNGTLQPNVDSFAANEKGTMGVDCILQVANRYSKHLHDASIILDHSKSPFVNKVSVEHKKPQSRKSSSDSKRNTHSIKSCRGKHDGKKFPDCSKCNTQELIAENCSSDQNDNTADAYINTIKVKICDKAQATARNEHARRVFPNTVTAQKRHRPRAMRSAVNRHRPDTRPHCDPITNFSYEVQLLDTACLVGTNNR